jgi:DNA polymerase-3 subunit gamma/tau
LLSFGGKHITVADVHSMLGTAGSSRLASLAECLLRRDAAAALGEVEAAVGEGVDLGQFTEQLLGYVRDALAANVGCSGELLLHTTAGDLDRVKQFGSSLGLETMLAVAQILDQTLVRMRQSTHVRTLLEVALIRICKLEDLDQLPALVASLRDGTPVNLLPQVGAQAQGVSPSSPGAEKKNPAPIPVDQIKSSESTAEPGPPPVPTIPSVQSYPEPLIDISSAQSAWQQTLAEHQDMTGDCASKYESVAISAPNRLVVAFRKDYITAKEFCERPDKRSRLEQTLSRITGRDMRIDFVVSPDDPQSVSRQAVAAKPPVSPRQRQFELRKNPLVRHAVELFDAEIVTVVDPPPSEAEISDQPNTDQPAA